MFKFLKRSIFILLICILIFAVSSAIWFLFPQKNIDSPGLLSDDCLIYGNFNIVAEDTTLNLIENNLLKLSRNNDFQKKLFRIASKLISSIKIAATLDYTPNSKRPDYLIIVNGKMVNKVAMIGTRGFVLCNLIRKNKRKVAFGFLGNLG